MSERRQAFKEPGYRGKVGSLPRIIIMAGYGPPTAGSSGTLKIEVEDNGIGGKREDLRSFLPPFLPLGLRP